MWDLYVGLGVPGVSKITSATARTSVPWEGLFLVLEKFLQSRVRSHTEWDQSDVKLFYAIMAHDCTTE